MSIIAARSETVRRVGGMEKRWEEVKTAPAVEDHVLVIFGANGDLARRKLLPALYHLAEEGLLPARYAIIGSSRSEMSTDEFRDFAREAIDEFCRCEPSEPTWRDFSQRLSYVSHDFRPGHTHVLDDAVRKAEADLGGSVRRLFYLAVPPVAFPDITKGLAECGLTEQARVVYEKPFGTDIDSFRRLNSLVNEMLDTSQIYRIDHFLGKETLQNILALRFANGMFEPVWNRSHIDHVQIDVPEELGVGARAGFYEKTGAFRDMIVTHLFQALSFIAMEPPSSLNPEALINEKVKVFESMVPLKPDDIVRGRFEGYEELNGVRPDSDTETFAAARVFIDNWRWADVPFYLRTGKRMAQSRQSITLAFRKPPLSIFSDAPAQTVDRNHLSLELGHDEGISLSFLAKVPGPTIRLGPARMDFRYKSAFSSRLIEAYERLIHDALIGDPTLFTRPDGIERTWEIVTNALAHPSRLHRYPQGSWGPRAAEELIAPRRWHLPERM
jgi:glucose-6-phosphate 1-dehydrogenase